MRRQKGASRPSITVEIAGERHILRSDAPADYTHSVAAHVDETIQQLGAGSALEPHRRAILAALVITDELFRAREEARQLREEIERRAGLVADRLEAVTEKADISPSTPG